MEEEVIVSEPSNKTNWFPISIISVVVIVVVLVVVFFILSGKSNTPTEGDISTIDKTASQFISENTQSVDEETCSERRGILCEASEQCTTGFIMASDGACCLGSCFDVSTTTTPTPIADEACAEQGGQFCYQNLCDGNKVSSSDGLSLGKECCLGSCPSKEREPCTSNSDCDDSDPCTIDVCGLAGISGCGYNQITECKTFSDGCCPAGCDSTTDGDCQAPTQTCSDGTPEETCVYERTGQESDKPKYCYSNLILQDNCNQCGCPAGKECAGNLTCLTPVSGGSYLYTESDFTGVGIDLVVNPLTQEITKSFDDEYVFDVYKSQVGDLFSVLVMSGVFVPGYVADTEYVAWGFTLLNEDEYGDDSIRLKGEDVEGTEFRILRIEKGEWGIEIWYEPTEETQVNNLATIGLGKI